MFWEFTRPDRCVVGTVGKPGKRLFLIQVAEGNRLAAVAVEKQQVLLLSMRITEVLDQVSELGHEVPPEHEPFDLGPLDAPPLISFRASAIGLAWDQETNRLVLELISVEFDEESGDNWLLQVRLSPAMAREFTARAAVMVTSGRPSCPACGQPLDPDGHICPRANGYRGPLFL